MNNFRLIIYEHKQNGVNPADTSPKVCITGIVMK